MPKTKLYSLLLIITTIILAFYTDLLVEFTLSLITLVVAIATYHGLIRSAQSRPVTQENNQQDSSDFIPELKSLNNIDLEQINRDDKLQHKLRTAMSMINSLPTI